ncbi:MAG: energy transducer TonB [Saprospiraceae bacterium]
MKNNAVMNLIMDDVVFHDRNKAYGAYFIRRIYDNNMNRAFFYGISLYLFLVCSPMIVTLFKGDSLLMEEISLPPIILNPEIPYIIQRTPPTPENNNNKIQSNPPVVKDSLVDEQDTLDATDYAKTSTGTSNIGEQNGTGESNGANPDIDSKGDIPAPIPLDETFKWVEEMPEFPNGTTAMYDYFKHNVKYPSIAREYGIEGTVLVQFVVQSDGAIRKIKLVRGIGGGCDEEALRVISVMPNWKAGKHNGKAVPVIFTIPIKYKLEK